VTHEMQLDGTAFSGLFFNQQESPLIDG